MPRSCARTVRPAQQRAGRRHAGERAPSRRRRRVLLLAVALTLSAGPASGYWRAGALGQGSAGTGTLTAPSAVTASLTATPGTVAVSWAAAAAPANASPPGYYITRVRTVDGVTAPACGTSAIVTTAGRTCQDQPVDGSYTYVVTAVHHSWTAASAPAGPVTVDTAPPGAPSAPQLTADSDTGASSADRITADSTPTFTGSAEAGATVTLYSGSTPLGSGTATGGSYTITTSVLGNSAHAITARATDVAGNTGAASASTQVTVDTVAPTVTVNQASGQLDPTRTQPIVFTVVFAEAVSGFDPADLVLVAPAGATVQVSGTGPTYDVSVSGMTADGSVSLSVAAGAAVDVAGNASVVSTSVDASVSRDTTAPGAPSAPTLTVASDSGSSSVDRITKVVTPTFTGTAEPGATVALFDGASQVGSGVATGGTYTITTSTLSEGSPTITATATDLAGNTGPASVGTTVTIDTTAPAVPSAPDLTAASDSATTTDNITNVIAPTFTGTVTTGSTITLYTGSTAVATMAISGGTYTLTTSSLAQGAQTITARTTDVAGNTSAASAGLSVTIDSVAPIVSISDVTYSSGLATTTGTGGRLTGDSSSVSVVICAVDSWPCTSGNTDYSGTEAVTLAGAWVDLSSRIDSCLLVLCDGPGQIYVRATQSDHAGNVGVSNVVSRYFS